MHKMSALHKQRKLVQDSIESVQRQGESMHALSSKFYTRLLQIDPTQGDIFDGSPVTLNRKFSNMMATFKNLERLETITSAIEAMSRRHLTYGMQPAHLDSFKAALLFALEKQLREMFTDELKQAWSNCYDDVAAIIRKEAKAHPELFRVARPKQHMHHDMSLLADIGGADVVKQVLARFYDIIFADAWLGQFFYGKSKTGLTNKQSKFMVAAFGGVNAYEGEPPALSHMHMYITEEMSLTREKMLRQAISDQGLGIDIARRWLSVDQSFWPSIHKLSVDECVTKCFGQVPVVVKKPENYKPY